MADTAIQTTPSSDKEDRTVLPTIEKIKARISNELIIGLCGAVGSGTLVLREQLKEQLEDNGYQVVLIKVSKLIEAKAVVRSNVKPMAPENRVIKLQNAGNSLRKSHGNDYLAKLAIRDISSNRSVIISATKDTSGGEGAEDSDVDENKTRKKVAYLVDQLKHPEESKLFKAVYPKNYYLVSLIRTEKERRSNLEEAGHEAADVDHIIRDDRKQEEKHGQQVEKTVYLGDYFIRNLNGHAENLKKEIKRFLQLVHGVQGIFPRKDERGMSAAYSASLQSACLSRQVGAAIVDDKGVIISTGRNDVPEFGGGLYSFESQPNDYRCIQKGMKCYNDLYKERLRKEIEDVLTEKEIPNAIVLSEVILSNTKARDLIEYSRAIHAEMDAIITLARKDSASTAGKVIYCTTYPCHNCARHIVAAGIVRVIYIEPYEKSLALKLHDDAISDSNETKKVSFEPYEGVSPSRYMAFFHMVSPRKDDSGNAVVKNIESANHIDGQYLDNYHAYEDKIVEGLDGS